MSTRAEIQIIGEGEIYSIYRIRDGDAATVIGEIIQVLDGLPMPGALIARLLRNPAYSAQSPGGWIDTRYQVVYEPGQVAVTTWIRPQ